MPRICPKCNKVIKSDQALFCYYCGAVLDPPNGNATPTKNVETVPNKPSKNSHRPKMLKIGIFAFFLMLIATGAYFGYGRIANGKKAEEEIVSPMDQTKNVPFEIDLSSKRIKLATGKFNKSELSQISPVGVNSFIALNDPGTFYENFIEKKSEIDINKLTGLSVEEIASFLEPSFAIIGRENSWAFIAKTKNKDFLKTKIEEINPKELDNNLEIEIIGNFLIVSNDVNILSEMRAIEQGASLSLSRDGFFVEATKNLPSEGVALVFYRDINKIKPLLESATGEKDINPKGRNAFAAIKSGEGAVLQF